MHRRVHPRHHTWTVIKALIATHTMAQQIAEQKRIRQGQAQERICTGITR